MSVDPKDIRLAIMQEVVLERSGGNITDCIMRATARIEALYERSSLADDPQAVERAGSMIFDQWEATISPEDAKAFAEQVLRAADGGNR